MLPSGTDPCRVGCSNSKKENLAPGSARNLQRALAKSSEKAQGHHRAATSQENSGLERATIIYLGSNVLLFLRAVFPGRGSLGVWMRTLGSVEYRRCNDQLLYQKSAVTRNVTPGK